MSNGSRADRLIAESQRLQEELLRVAGNLTGFADLLRESAAHLSTVARESGEGESDGGGKDEGA